MRATLPYTSAPHMSAFPDQLSLQRPVVIGHRGACGYRPEHTLASYELAVRMGADFIETDIVPTRDGILICRHESELSRSTSALDFPDLVDQKRRKIIEGVEFAGIFSEDLTFAQIQRLRAREPMDLRSDDYDDQFPIASLEDLLDAFSHWRSNFNPRLGLIIEVKHPTYFESLGLDIGQNLHATLERAGLLGDDSPVVAESFETSILQRLHQRSGLRIIQLLDAPQMAPADRATSEHHCTYADLMTPAGLAAIREYAFAIGPWKRLIVPQRLAGEMGDRGASVRLDAPTSLIADAHAAGLQVHSWTFRSEAGFLAEEYAGDPLREYEQFLLLGLDGFISDFPDVAVQARDGFGQKN